jgi:predicted transposase YbfD/YdcC
MLADDIPLVYNAENTGAGCTRPPLPAIEDLPSIVRLPNPFEWSGHGLMGSFDDWRCRRAEIKADIENYGKSKESWLRQYLQLPNGIPSHDTFNRFFSALAPEDFEEAFIRWVRDIADLTQGEVVSIDGKSLRGTRECSPSKRAVHIVSAWANSNQLSLDQVKVDEKSNEITAIPQLLEVLTLQGSIALHLVKNEQSKKRSMKGKRLDAGWNNN